MRGDFNNEDGQSCHHIPQRLAAKEASTDENLAADLYNTLTHID